MRKLIMAGIAMLSIAISSCDEETLGMGNSLSEAADRFTVITSSFPVATTSISTDSVLARSIYSYLGRMKDPETDTYITADYMTQFHLLENEADVLFPPQSYIDHYDTADGKIVADSCFVNVMINAYQGDSLTAMKLTLAELDSPVKENELYYTDYDPEEKVRAAAEGGMYQNKIYSVSNLTLNDSIRGRYRTNAYFEYIKIPLNKTYHGKDGKDYSNYGTYILRKYYEHPEYFKNAYTFTKNICPGFYIKTVDGLGLMIEVASTQLVVYYHYQMDGESYLGSKTFKATEEVLQTTHVTNDKAGIKRLKEDNTCTYLKTPSGLFTEIELPVDKIKQDHLNDTITSAGIVFRRMNAANSMSEAVLEEPENLLLIERDSLYTFFEHSNVPDNITSYLATFNSTYKTYTFNNISNLINRMYDKRGQSENWNKAVLVPVQLTTTVSSSSTTTIAAVSNEMNINSVRLLKGTNDDTSPVYIDVVYSKNE